MMRRHRRAAAVLAVLSTLALAACGDDGGRDVATLGDGAASAADDRGGGDDRKDRDQALLDYARCMREQGIDMPDPQFDDEGRAALQVVEPGGDRAAFEAAHEACDEHMEGVLDGGPGVAPDPEFQDRLIRFTRCMREQGIDMPDPQFDGDGMARVRPGAAVAFDPEDPAFKKAQEACKQFEPTLPGGEDGER